MTLKEHINDIRSRLKEGGYISEIAISNQIVVRLLRELGWPIYDEWTVIFEYTVGGSKKVDLALCVPRAEPVIFIETKVFEKFFQKYEVKCAKEQLSEYIWHFQNNTHKEVSIAILTDGQKWIFFHPVEEENWKESPVCELDLIENEIEEIVECLDRYLNYESICTGKVIEKIKDDYRSINSPSLTDKYSRRLRVTMPNGEVINCPDSKDTFVEVIVKLGLEDVARVRPNIVKKSCDGETPPFKCCCQRNSFYINTSQPLKWQRRNTLVRISRQLCVHLKIERIDE